MKNVVNALDINQFGYTGFNNISFSDISGTYTKYAEEFDIIIQKYYAQTRKHYF